MSERFDVVIAGAGVGGCLLARDLARSGRRVALLDKQDRKGLGHDWWDSVHLEVFPEVGLPEPMPPEAMMTTGDETVFPPLETVKYHIPKRVEKRNIDRKLFARRMLGYAEESGAVFFESTAVTGLVRDGDTIVGVSAKGPDGGALEFKSSFVIDATGFDAVLRRNMDADAYGFSREIDRSEQLITYREIRNRPGDLEENILIFGKSNGVNWIRRSQPGLIDFFAGVIDLPGRPDPRSLVEELKSRVSDYGPEIVRAGSGAPIPVRRGFDSFVAPGFLLCGDSACQCNPIDGSGVMSALRAARIAAEVVDHCLEQGRTDVEALWPYNVRYTRTQGARFATLHALQRFMISEPKLNLELLFRRNIINPKDFWGSGAAGGGDETTIKRLLKLLRLLDRPRFVGRLVRAMTTAKKITAHYEQFPERWDPAGFQAWRDETRRLYSVYPPPWDAR